MKAYSLSIDGDDDAGQEIVFANTGKEAKKKIGDLADNLERYIDLRVHRDKRYDGMETLDAKHLALAQWKDGWIWFAGDTPDVEEATDEEFFAWYEDIFGVKS